MSTLLVSLPQHASRLADVDANLKAILSLVKDSDADLVVFPELFLTGYVIKDDTRTCALELGSEPVRRISAAAKKHRRAVVFGMPEKSPSVRGQVHNTAVVALPDGSVGVYRKMHPVNFGPFEEMQYFTAGRELPLFDICGMRFGIIICYDLFFPELARAYALMGADAVLCISASPSTTRGFFETVMPARAIENTVYMLYSNQVGTQGNMVFPGGSVVYGPRGDLKARGELFSEQDLCAELDSEELRIARTFRPTIRDARPELLEHLARIKRIAGIDQKE